MHYDLYNKNNSFLHFFLKLIYFTYICNKYWYCIIYIIFPSYFIIVYLCNLFAHIYLIFVPKQYLNISNHENLIYFYYQTRDLCIEKISWRIKNMYSKQCNKFHNNQIMIRIIIRYVHVAFLCLMYLQITWAEHHISQSTMKTQQRKRKFFTEMRFYYLHTLFNFHPRVSPYI